MRWRTLMWFVPGLLMLLVCWRSDHRGLANEDFPPVDTPRIAAFESFLPVPSSVMQPPASPAHPAPPLRLTNTAKPIGELVESDRAIILENALLDTGSSLSLAIPDGLRITDGPGSYIVQSRGPLNQSFRSTLALSGASVVGYIPNNALLVRASAAAARALANQPQVQAVLPFEPYYKLKPSLLRLLLARSPGAAPAASPIELNVLLFGDAEIETLPALEQANARLILKSSSPLGPMAKVACTVDTVAALARLPGVQAIELSRRQIPSVDLVRSAVGVASNSTSPANYRGLTGSNVLVHVLDTGVDATHPDLSGRVFFDHPSSGTDTNGHGTHVAGILIGSGAFSLSVSNVQGSSMPAAPFQFRGLAPRATAWSMVQDPAAGQAALQGYLEQAAAHTNSFILNASWSYEDANEYDLAAVIFDAAVRDSLPLETGSQPLLCVVAAGNGGTGLSNGTGGLPNSIASPGTAKNVITVGATENRRFVTNETWTCTSSNSCTTNTPWLGLTDNPDHVASFSGRGNVGLGIEGPFGRVKPDLVARGTFVLAPRSSQWDQAGYAATNDILIDVPDANYFQVLSNLNRSVGPLFRFESGTSLAAAQASGTLALMQEFFQRLGQTPSPALLKALLINGARGAGTYGIQVHGGTNFQGWGALRLPSSLPAGLSNSSPAGLLYFDQDPAAALSTGESCTRCISVRSEARSSPLRVTLVWTDPPGNPAAGIKLVNDLDLIVTNLQSGEVYFGNNIAAGASFSQPWNANGALPLDAVNNVENVLLNGALGANYSVTVRAKRVNVNAVASSPAQIVQDYALVISSGDGERLDALSLETASTDGGVVQAVTALTNQFTASSSEFGSILWRERISAGPPLLSVHDIPLNGLSGAALAAGNINQWRFYVFTNDTLFTNAAFLTMPARPLTINAGRAGATTDPAAVEADVDLYVSLDASLTNLDANAIAGSMKSLGRGGAEMIILTNAWPGVFYIGMKCESQSAAEYGLAALLSELPFAETDLDGNQVVRGVPAPASIPAGGSASLIGIAPTPVLTRRVVITNVISHPAGADLAGTLTHDAVSVVLNNHSTNLHSTAVYDDTQERDIAGTQHTDGPGTLEDFGGRQGGGLWLLEMASTNRPGTNESLSILLDHQPDGVSGFNVGLLPGACRRDFVEVPANATNVVLEIGVSAGTGPVSLQFCPLDTNPSNAPTLFLDGSGTNVRLTNDHTSVPPLRSAVYAVNLCNLGPDAVQVGLMTSFMFDLAPPALTKWIVSGPVDIRDEALTVSSIALTNSGLVEQVEVGVRIEHPRVSDLAISLVSPGGRRVLLQENRGDDSSEGMGFEMLVTNATSLSWEGGPEAVTNVLDTGQVEGFVTIDYQFWSLPDQMRVYYENALLFDTGMVSWNDRTNLSYGPGTSTLLTIVMNPEGNPDTNTAWYYKASSTRIAPVPLTFTEDTNLTLVPIKFASPPLTNANYSPPGSYTATGLFYLPEQSLDTFTGETAAGLWSLEIRDVRAGATNPAPRLLVWELGLKLTPSVAEPLPLPPGFASTNLLGPGQERWFYVDAPRWAHYATNALIHASLPVDLLFNPSTPVAGTNNGAVVLLSNAVAGTVVLSTNTTPPLLPGWRYFLGVRNTNALTVSCVIQTGFDVTVVPTLDNGVAYEAVSNGPARAVDYYRFLVSTNALRLQIEIKSPSENLSLLAHRGLPLPGGENFDYASRNPWTNNELIVIYDSSSPVPLTAGEWFFAVENVSGLPASYFIQATEFPIAATNIFITQRVLTNESFCLTWTSLPGAHYFVQGKVGFLDSDWVTVSPTVTATDALTTYCVPASLGFQFFRICEGLVITPQPLLIDSITAASQGVLLRWGAPPGTLFHVEWAPLLHPPGWSAFTNTLNSDTGLYEFLDDGTQSSGLGQTRFYRLLKLP